jgi:VanZ family protein
MRPSDTAIVILRITLASSLLGIIALATAELTHPLLTSVNDKVGHIVAFLYLAFLLDFSFPDSHFDKLKVILLLAYGLLIEVIQYFLPYRTFSFLDLVADGVGVTLYFLLIPILKYIPLVRLRWRG